MSGLPWRRLYRQKRTKRSRAGRRLSFSQRFGLLIEPLEQRQVLSVTLNAVTGPDAGGVFDIPAGKDLYVPIIGTDVGQSITYTATSNNPGVKVSVLSGNPTLQMTVHGQTAGGTAFSGTMTFQLFANIAPQTVQGIMSQVNAGLYNGASFYRMETASDFQLIQGGIEKTAGKTDNTILPDEFNVNASFNSSGLLAMANAGPGTATSEFFITAPNRSLSNDPQSLNFGYTIFGQILTGLDIYNDILQAPTTNQGGINFANSPITIDSATIINDTQNAVLQISEGNTFTGQATITVTGTGSDTTSAQQSFTVSVAAPSSVAQNVGTTFLNPVANQTTPQNTPVTIQLTGTDTLGGTPTFSITGSSSFTATPPAGITVSAGPGGAGSFIITPAAGFSGTVTLLAHADGTNNGFASHDAEAFTVTVTAPVVISSVTNPINASNPTSTSIHGTGEVGATISVVASDGTHSTTAKTATVGSDGTWTITGIDVSTLNDGTITYTANSTDAQNNTSQDAKTATKDTQPPAVSVTTVTNPVTSANATNTSASGTGEVGAAISVVATDGTHTTAAAQTTVGAGGTWTVSGIDTSTLTDGTITYTATATDTAGNTATNSKTATKDTVAPTLNLTSVTNPITLANSTNTTANGTGEVGASISVVASDGAHATSAKTTTVGGDGTWTITGVDVSGLNDGTITYTATASDAVGNTTVKTLTATKITVSIVSVTDPINIANSTNVGAHGIGNSGDSISVVVSDGTHTTTAATTTVGQDGTWTVSGIDVTALSDGTVTYTVTATDAQEHSAQITKTASKDTTIPTLSLTSFTNPVNNTNVANATASGDGEVGDTVSVVVTDGTHTTAAKTATVAANGTWTVTGLDLSSLADGSITYTATATDLAGNTATENQPATKDTVAPAVAVVAVTNPVNIANVKSASANGTGEAGATISLVVTDGTNSTSAKTTIVGEGGTWTITGIDLSSLTDGTITYTATASDAAGNTATSSLTATKATVTIATVTSPINASNAGNITVSGTGQAGATIALVISDGTHSTNTFIQTVSAGGTWSVTAIDLTSLNDGTLTLTATASDAQDNTAQTTKTVTKDTVAPAVAVSSVTSPVNSSNAANTSANGTGEVGATISVVASDGTHTSAAATGTVGSDGTWTVTGINVSTLTDGTITYTATATDTAGNSASATKTSTKDTVAPAVALSTVTSPVNNSNASSTSASGTGEAGATISVVASDGSHTTSALTTTVSAAGTWTLTGINLTTLTDGTITYTATATDAAGNTATSTKTTTKDTVAPAVAVTSVTSPIGTANEASLTASGTGEAGATISVVASDGTHTTSALTTTVGSGGTWTITGINATSLGDGTITFTATATDAAGNTATASDSATKNTSSASLSGFVFVDSTDSALKASDPRLAGVILTLTGTDSLGHAIPLETATTDSNGFYQFTNLSAGTYTITEAQPAKVSDGSAFAGSLGGTTSDNKVSNIAVTDGAQGVHYDFTEHGLVLSMISARLLLASAPPVQQAIDAAISTFGTLSPVVTSFTKSDTDPAPNASVHYNVTFNKPVTGVSSSNFSVQPSSGLSGAAITSVSGSGNSYTVTANAGTGTGTLGIELASAASIQDSAGHALSDTLPVVGPNYTITSSTSSQAAPAAQPSATQLIDQAFGSNDLLQ